LNPFTKLPHSAQYKKILEGRKKLPVFAQMQEFYKMVSGGIALGSLVELGNFTVATFEAT
jgi:pre-mRNA-splicing factor ATP-dependent RNA helicase DHX15/PRP43